MCYFHVSITYPSLVLSALLFLPPLSDISSTQNATKRVYFGRDPLGRRSLLLSRSLASEENLSMILTSVSNGANPPFPFKEVDTGSLHCFDLTSLGLNTVRKDWLEFIGL